MTRRKSPRIIPVILVLIAIAIAVAVLISVARYLFLPRADDNKNDKADTAVVLTPRESLLDTSADRSVSLIASGPIVAQENFRSYQITIGPSQRKLVLYEGYLGAVVDTLELGNNVNAYTQFVYALDKAGLANGEPLNEDDGHRMGVCATGEFYQFDLLKNYNKDLIARFWTSTCSGSKGTLDANPRQVIDLFVQQIPGARSILRNINVYASS